MFQSMLKDLLLNSFLFKKSEKVFPPASNSYCSVRQACRHGGSDSVSQLIMRSFTEQCEKNNKMTEQKSTESSGKWPVFQLFSTVNLTIKRMFDFDKIW